jgi:hypothetical protein
MPIVKLYRGECERDLLPDICMKCGQKSTVRVEHTFHWLMPWIVAVALGCGFWVGLIVIFIVWVLSSKMTVRVPLCDAHKTEWSRRYQKMLYWGFASVLLILFAVIYHVENSKLHNHRNDTEGITVAIVLFYAYIASLGFLHFTAIRPSKINRESITLEGVSGIFFYELEHQRQTDTPEQQFLRRAVSAEQDDFDDRDRD